MHKLQIRAEEGGALTGTVSMLFPLGRDRNSIYT